MSDGLNFHSLSEQELMAGLFYGEARIVERDPVDEIHEYIAIGCVVMNRVASRHLGDDNVKDVILRPRQFSCFNEDDPNRMRIWDFLQAGKRGKLPTLNDQIKYKTLMLYAGEVLRGATDDFSRGASHYVARWLFEKPETRNHPWIPKCKTTAIYGGHVFLRSPEFAKWIRMQGGLNVQSNL